MATELGWDRMELRGLEIAPPQCLGSVRLVPLLRRDAPGDVRLDRRVYRDTVGVVSLEGELLAAGVKYASIIPHGLVMSWSDDGAPVVPTGTHLGLRDGKQLRAGCLKVRVMHRMARREERNRLRLLPLHLAMEGFLAMCFGGPDIAYAEYSRQVISHGLDPRFECSVSGASLPGFREALRVFEIHEHQVGVMVFIAGALASVFVVPHPDDYRALHRSLLEDFFGALLYRYGLLHPEVTPGLVPLDDAGVRTLDDVRAALRKVRKDWAAYGQLLAQGLVDVPVTSEVVYRAGRFTLLRFMTPLSQVAESHIGEAVLRDDGTLEYLKTYRLSDAQVRRAGILRALTTHGWHVEDTAASLGLSRQRFIRRVEDAGLGWIFRTQVLQDARRV